MIYREVAEAIRRDIQAGHFQPGHALPAQAQLAARYRASVGTVSNAIRWLAAEGWVRPELGRGTFVADVLPNAARPLAEELAELKRRVDEHDRRLEEHDRRLDDR